MFDWRFCSYALVPPWLEALPLPRPDWDAADIGQLSDRVTFASAS